MNRCSIVLIMLVLSLLSTGNCFAGETGLGYKVGYEVRRGNSYMPAVVAYMDGATKGFDGEHMWSGLPSSGMFLAIRKVKGVSDWNGDTGWYGGDIREALAYGQSITVDGIYLWAAPGTPNQDMYLRLVDRPYLEPGVSFSLSLVSVPQGIDYTGPTTWGPETSIITLPFYSTDNGETGYKFQMNVFAVVPEPSSLLALGVGLLPLAVGLRRRCRRSRRHPREALRQ